MHKFLSFISLFLITATATARPAKVTRIEQTLVINEIIQEYSHAWNGPSARITKKEIWGLALAENDSESCYKTVTGYAHKPSASGKSTYQFWVCLTKDSSGKIGAQFLDDVQIADE